MAEDRIALAATMLHDDVAARRLDATYRPLAAPALVEPGRICAVGWAEEHAEDAS